MPAIRKRSIEHLECYLPAKLIKFGECSSAVVTHLRADDLKRVISIARETGVQWILPVAFYWLSQFEIDFIFLDKLAQLSKEDLKVCIQGRETLYETMASRGALGFSISDRCTNVVSDKARLVEIKLNASLKHKRHPLSLSLKKFHLGLCDACSEEFSLRTDACCKAAWEKLPQWFGLPMWPELLAARDAQ